MRVTQDAIPGMRIPCWFRPTKEGHYQINCAQLCGNGHSSMSGGFLVIESQAKYEEWLPPKPRPVRLLPASNSFEPIFRTPRSTRSAAFFVVARAPRPCAP